MEEQRAAFEQALATLARSACAARCAHAANSAALLRDSRVWYDLVRPGLLLYGVVPPPLASTMPLRPAMSLRSRVVAVKGMRAGRNGGLRRALHGRAADARSRSCPPATPTASTCAWRAAGGARSRPARADRRLGLHGHDPARRHRHRGVPGDEVVLLGRRATSSIDAREMAASIGTIPWEVLCRLGTRIERIYSVG